MSATADSHEDVVRPAQQRLKLVTNTPSPPGKPANAAIREEGSSPVRPSYSPVTPTLSQTNLADQDDSEQWMNEPEPLPVSLDENPDAIALRAALSILQMQRQQSLRDIRQLDKLKQEGLKNPKAFVDDLKSGKLREAQHETNSLGPDESDEEDSTIPVPSRFGTLPNAQNIVRYPPIEWSKYDIVGEALETMHDVQQRYPGLTDQDLARGVQPQPREVAAPYRPFTDKIDPQSTSTNTRHYDT